MSANCAPMMDSNKNTTMTTEALQVNLVGVAGQTSAQRSVPDASSAQSQRSSGTKMSWKARARAKKTPRANYDPAMISDIGSHISANDSNVGHAQIDQNSLRHAVSVTQVPSTSGCGTIDGSHPVEDKDDCHIVDSGRGSSQILISKDSSRLPLHPKNLSQVSNKPPQQDYAGTAKSSEPKAAMHKRKLRDLHVDLKRKFKAFARAFGFQVDSPDETGLGRLIINDQQRNDFVQKVVGTCQQSPSFREKFLGEAEKLANLGFFTHSTRQRLIKGSNGAAPEKAGHADSRPSVLGMCRIVNMCSTDGAFGEEFDILKENAADLEEYRHTVLNVCKDMNLNMLVIHLLNIVGDS